MSSKSNSYSFSTFEEMIAIYLQSEFIGAEALLGRSISNDDFRLSVEEFIPYFRDLSATHIENILCIMKDYFVAQGITPCEAKRFNICVFNYQRIFTLFNT